MINRGNGIIKLINEGKTHNEICKKYGLSNQELEYQLYIIKKSLGLNYNRIFCSDGNIIYSLDRSLTDKVNHKAIYIDESKNEFKALAISDLHIGHKLMDINLLDKVYQYCIDNNIHLIFCIGNMIDGGFKTESLAIKEPLEQIEYVINHFPKHSNILVYGVYGESEDYTKMNYGIDIQSVLSAPRPDINIARGYTQLALKNDNISLSRYLLNNKITIELIGGCNQFSVDQLNGQVVVSVPSLCNIFTENSGSVVDMQLNFENQKITYCKFKEINFTTCTKVISENDFKLQPSSIPNELPSVKKLVK